MRRRVPSYSVAGIYEFSQWSSPRHSDNVGDWVHKGFWNGAKACSKQFNNRSMNVGGLPKQPIGGHHYLGQRAVDPKEKGSRLKPKTRNSSFASA